MHRKSSASVVKRLHTIHAIVGSHDDDLLVGGEACSVIERISARAILERSPIDPKHNRITAGTRIRWRTWSIDIQVQAVFALGVWWIVDKLFHEIMCGQRIYLGQCGTILCDRQYSQTNCWMQAGPYSEALYTPSLPASIAGENRSGGAANGTPRN